MALAFIIKKAHKPTKKVSTPFEDEKVPGAELEHLCACQLLEHFQAPLTLVSQTELVRLPSAENELSGMIYLGRFHAKFRTKQNPGRDSTANLALDQPCSS